MRIGLLGGSFDPVHNGHLRLGRAAQRQLRLDRVYFVLSPRSPFKSGRRSTPAPVRWRLLRAALQNEPRLQAADWELKRRGPSYTVTTLRNLKKRRPRDEIFLVLGSDAWRSFSRWRRADEIARLATPVVGLRPGARLTRSRFPFRRLSGRFPDLSSTQLRRDLAGRGPRVHLNGRLPVRVRALVRKHDLYRSPT